VRAVVTLYRDAFGGLPAITWLLCTAAFLNRCGSMVVPFLGPYLKKSFGFTAEQGGYVIALYGVGAFVGSWIGGWLTDRIGPVKLQVAALGSASLWMLLMTQFRTPETVVPAVFVLGVLNDAFRPGSNTAAAISAPVELRRKALSLNRFALNLGWAFGPTIGGYLVAIDYSWMFVADGATCGIAALWLWIALRNWNPVRAQRPASDAPNAAALGGERPLRDPHFLWLMAANLCVLLAFMQYFTTGPRVFDDQGHDEHTIGWLLAINPILITLFEMPIVHGLRGRRTLPVIAIGSLVVGLGYLCLLLPFGIGAIVLAMVVVAGGELLQMPMLGAHVNDRAPDHARGAYNGAYGMTFTLALVLAPIAGGNVYDSFGATALWAASGAIALLGGLMFAFTRR
jgi:predicted MFS family arabinose efflux permease